MTTKMSGTIDLKFIKRGRGQVLLFNGRQYFKKKTYVSRAEWWRCCSKFFMKQCPGSITIKDDKIVKEVPHHPDCMVDTNKNFVAEKLEECKKSNRTTDKPIPQLYEELEEAYKDTGCNLVHDIPSFNKVKTGLYRMRNKNLEVPKVVYNEVVDVVIPQKYNDFLLADYNCDGLRIVLFSSKIGLERMATLKHFFGDGTFEACPPPFSQIYTIHGDNGSTSETTHISPLIYALMSHKSCKAYLILFEMVKSRIMEWDPMKFTSDFEKSAIKAITTVFPNINTKGCYFHFHESLKRKAKSLNIFKDKNNRRCVFLCRNLALLPQKEISAGWNYIEAIFSKYKHLEQFLKYFRTNWLKPKIVKQWCIFDERHRTNNFVEGWHTKLNKHVKRNNRSILEVIRVFKTDANSKSKPVQRKSQSKINDNLIREGQLSLLDGQISIGHFLEMMR